MTEDQAKEKWCPFVHVNGSNVNIDSPVKGNPIPIFRPSCIASGCMMWRWLPKFQGLFGPDEEPKKNGYCGLAGKPLS